MNDKVLIIGAGLGGLSAAITLAQAGFKVTVLEKNAHCGGKMHVWRDKGFRFDTGPGLLTMPFVIEELLKTPILNLSNHLHTVPVNPICKYFYPDGSVFNGWQAKTAYEFNQLESEVRNFSEADALALSKYLQKSKRLFEATYPIFLRQSLYNKQSLFSRAGLKALFSLHHLHPFLTLHEYHSKIFQSQKLIQLFDRYATYSGSDPYKAPAALSIIPHVEYTLGSYYIKGGMYKLAELLFQQAQNYGVTFYFETEVKKILHDTKKVTGLLIEEKNKRENILKASYIVSNADVVLTWTKLIDGFSFQKAAVKKLEPSCSGLVFLWGVTKQFPDLLHHNIFFSGNYKDEFEALFGRKTYPEDPTIYITITSKTDSSDAPEGCENWFVLINAPSLSQTTMQYPEVAKQVKKAVLQKLNVMGIQICEEDILCEKIITPKDILTTTKSNKGSIYGISSNSKLTAFLRQKNRSSELKGLYFAGGSAHPGGGIPLVLLSGMIVGESILKDC
jgi:phytoene desaturase